MQIIFARHGESEANVEQIISNRNLSHNLTPQGRKQAHTLSDKLTSKNIAAIYASPIRRAQQTAQIIAEERHLPVHMSDALREFDCGIMEGRGDEEAWQAHQSVVQAWDDEDYDRRIAGGESFNDLQKRFVSFIQKLVSEVGNGDAAIVLLSHGGLLSQMLPLVLSNIDRAFTRDHSLGNCACVVAIPQREKLVCIEWDGIHLG